MNAKHASKVRLPYQTVHPRERVSRRLRIARALNISVAAADKKIYGAHAVNRECARILTADIDAGDTEAATLFLAPIDAACAPRQRLGLMEALHRAEMADCLEQLADETFREKLRQGTATVDDAREFIRRSAIARTAAEVAEREAMEWIREKESAANGD